MRKGVFSMYSTKEKRNSFYIRKYAFPNHFNTEISAHIANDVSKSISRNMKECVSEISALVVTAEQKKRGNF